MLIQMEESKCKFVVAINRYLPRYFLKRSNALFLVAVPLSVEGLSVTTPVAQTSFVLTWNAVTGAVTYDVTVTADGAASETRLLSNVRLILLVAFSFTLFVFSTANDATIEFTGRSEGTEYSVSIVAKTDTSMYGAQQTSVATTLTLKTGILVLAFENTCLIWVACVFGMNDYGRSCFLVIDCSFIRLYKCKAFLGVRRAFDMTPPVFALLSIRFQ